MSEESKEANSNHKVNLLEALLEIYCAIEDLWSFVDVRSDVCDEIYAARGLVFDLIHDLGYKEQFEAWDRKRLAHHLEEDDESN